MQGCAREGRRSGRILQDGYPEAVPRPQAWRGSCPALRQTALRGSERAVQGCRRPSGRAQSGNSLKSFRFAIAGRQSHRIPSGCSASEQVEVFLLLPLGDLRVEAGDLRLLDAEVVVDESVAQRGAEAGAITQRIERFL